MNGEFFELQIAREILATVRRCELPLQLDSLTEADGNCFPRFVRDSTMSRHKTRPYAIDFVNDHSDKLDKSTLDIRQFYFFAPLVRIVEN